MAIYVSNLDDDALRDYVQLRDVNLRRLLETERGIYLAEGEKIIRRAFKAGHKPRSFLLTERWLGSLSDIVDQTPATVFLADEASIEELTGFHVHRGALAAFERPTPMDPEHILQTSKKIFAVEDVTDHTNIGAIFRNAAALDFDAVLLAPRAADPLYRRSIKVAMGAVFSLPYARFTDWSSAVDVMREHSFTTLALSLDADAVDLATISEIDKIAVLLGSEGHGLSQHWKNQVDIRTRINMSRGIDSLNVAAASAIAAWHFR